jgi:hypothetical protein
MIETILFGALASAITLVGDRMFTATALRWRFAALSGSYLHYSRDGVTPRANADGSQRRTVLSHCGGGVFDVRSSTDKGDWQGRLSFDSRLPAFGSGQYQYLTSNPRSGVLQVIVMDNQRRMLVTATALSHPDLEPTVYLWVKSRAEG